MFSILNKVRYLLRKQVMGLYDNKSWPNPIKIIFSVILHLFWAKWLSAQIFQASSELTACEV